jgi:hypothetical protein
MVTKVQKTTKQKTKTKPESQFEPKIVVFACNWCSYPAADAAGINRLQYPANVRIIRVMCMGRVDPGFVLKALVMGADGVLVSGCHFEDWKKSFTCSDSRRNVSGRNLSLRQNFPNLPKWYGKWLSRSKN